MRPLFDAAYCTFLLIQVRLPGSAVLAMWVYGIFGIGVIKMLAPDFGGFQADGERLEGEFRSAHARLKSNAESVAFAGGSDAEKGIVTQKMEKVMRQAHKKNNARGRWRPIESFILYRMPEFVTSFLRMIWAQGYGDQTKIMETQGGTDISSTGEYIEMLIQRSFSTFSTLLGLNEDFQTLFGVVGRVTDLLLVMDELNDQQQQIRDKAEVESPPASPRAAAAVAAGAISCSGVDVVTPDGSCIARDVSFQVFADSASNLAITGGNAVGKSSLFRVMNGLWPLHKGRVDLPSADPFAERPGLSLVPQQPLVPTVAISLADMVTYPRHIPERAAEQERELTKLLTLVGLGYLAEREGWDGQKQWASVLSLGEQQALSIARLLWSNPQYAVLDECMSSVSLDLQVAVFKELSERSIATVAILPEITEEASGFFSQELRLGEAVADGWTMKPLLPFKAGDASGSEEEDPAPASPMAG